MLRSTGPAFRHRGTLRSRNATNSRSKLAFAVIAFAHALAPCVAEAQEGPVVVVVESADPHVDGATIRSRLAARLGVPVLSLFDPGAGSARGVLSVAVDRSGRHASVQYRPSGRIDRAMLVDVEADAAADAAGEWIVTPALSLIRTSESWLAAQAFATELLDPWLQARVEPERTASAMQLPPDVIDPFVGTPPRRVRVTVSELYLGDDVIDPWAAVEARVTSEAGERLSRPRPRSARRDR
jgi:hypothetical protein